MTTRVTVVEVGARDGLQNEKIILPTADKLAFLERLAACGLQRIEATTCVSAARVPQMADYPDILKNLAALPEAQWSVLVANQRGFDALPETGVSEIALFTAASDTFTEKNIGRNIADSLTAFAPLAEAARARNLRVRGYLSTVIRCPYTGAVAPAQVAQVARQLLNLGCDEISLGDTIGVGTPNTVRPLLSAVLNEIPAEQLAVHFHDTNGTAIANIALALDYDIRIIDAAVGGLGGCPFAPGAGGNVATEDVLYFLTAEGYDTGIDPSVLAATGRWISKKLERPYTAKAGLATYNSKQ